MSYKSEINDNKNFNSNDNSKVIEFIITENLHNLGIRHFIFQDREFIITWSNGKQICIGFSSKTHLIELIIKKIEKKIKKEVKDNEVIEIAIKEIEDQLIKRREEIFELIKIKNFEHDFAEQVFKSEFLEDVSKIREQFEKLANPY